MFIGLCDYLLKAPHECRYVRLCVISTHQQCMHVCVGLTQASSEHCYHRGRIKPAVYLNVTH